MTASEYWTCFTSGIKNMLNSLLLMVLAFLFAKVNAAIGFTYYMIQIAESFMTPHFLPRSAEKECLSHINLTVKLWNGRFPSCFPTAPAAIRNLS